MRRCKECGQNLPSDTLSRLCRCCYEIDHPKRVIRPGLWQGTAHPEPLLSFSERRRMEREQFEGREEEIWSEDFLDEWYDYLEDRGCFE